MKKKASKSEMHSLRENKNEFNLNINQHVQGRM